MNSTTDERITASPYRMAEAIELAERFHATYEQLAPQFGYETRPDTKDFDVTTPNGKLMVAVCLSLLDYADERNKILQQQLAASSSIVETLRDEVKVINTDNSRLSERVAELERENERLRECRRQADGIFERQISIFAVQSNEGGEAMARYAYGYVLMNPFGRFAERFKSDGLDKVMLTRFPDAIEKTKALAGGKE